MPKKSPNYFLYLSRNDTANVSYCPGEEIKDSPDKDWIDSILIPSLKEIMSKRGKKISNTPIAFWVCLRETARIPDGEIFIFSTPWRPGKQIDEMIRSSLSPLVHSKIYQGAEQIPDEAVPCCQCFRGKIIRFFGDFDGTGGVTIPTIRWRTDRPVVIFEKLDPLRQLTDTQPEERIFVRAKISSVADGNYYRLWQSALTSIAMLEA